MLFGALYWVEQVALRTKLGFLKNYDFTIFCQYNQTQNFCLDESILKRGFEFGNKAKFTKEK